MTLSCSFELICGLHLSRRSLETFETENIKNSRVLVWFCVSSWLAWSICLHLESIFVSLLDDGEL